MANADDDRPELENDELPDEPPDEPGVQPPNGLTKKQEDAILALLAEPTMPKVAQRVGISQRTLNRWLANPVFNAEYRRCRREAFTQPVGLTLRYAPLAVTTLVKLLNDAQTPHHARVTASVALLRFGREGIELDDLAGRIEVLEQAAKESKRN